MTMNMEYLIMQQKTADFLKEAEQRRLAREAQADAGNFDSLAANLEKIRLQLVERYTRQPQLPVTPDGCCAPA